MLKGTIEKELMESTTTPSPAKESECYPIIV